MCVCVCLYYHGPCYIVIKHLGHEQFGKDRDLFHLTGKSGQESQGRNIEIGTDTEDVEEICLLTCSCDMFSLLSYSTQEHLPVVVLLRVSWTLPYQSLIRKMQHRLAHNPISVHFLNWGSLLLNDSSLSSWHKTCQHSPYWFSILWIFQVKHIYLKIQSQHSQMRESVRCLFFCI